MGLPAAASLVSSFASRSCESTVLSPPRVASGLMMLALVVPQGLLSGRAAVYRRKCIVIFAPSPSPVTPTVARLMFSRVLSKLRTIASGLIGCIPSERRRMPKEC